MNIAFPAFFILLLILPGFLFINRYEKKENLSLESKGIDATSAQAVLVAIFLHGIMLVISNSFGKAINFTIISKLLTNDKLSIVELEKITTNIPWVLSYFSTIFILAYLSAITLQWIMFTTNPTKESKFAFNLPWYYELKGKVNKADRADVIRLTCMVVAGKDTYLYKGYLEDFYLNSDGTLDRIFISDVSRRFLKNNSHNNDPIKINITRMMIKYEEICNLTIDYCAVLEE
ncbi:TPA: hypothetical protein RFY31_003402 [Klebsiella aerogenes]|nr:hypothetical protein [Klebsiella aerogenes]